MNLFKIISYILGIAAIVFIFFDWKVAVGLFLLATVFRVIPLGPDNLLSVITGYLLIGGLIYIFFDWRIGVALIAASFLAARFRIWRNKLAH